MPKRLLLVGAGALAAIGLGLVALTADSGPAPPPPTAPPVAATTTPMPASTTAAPTLAFHGDGVDGEIDALVEALYRSISEGADPPDLPEGLSAHLLGAGPPSLELDSTTIVADLKYGQRVAVARVGVDSVLLADETEGWRIVGADLPSLGLGPWYGPALRTVLIVGSDARWNEEVAGARSDSLHILTAVPAEGAGAIVGIPRDSWVTTPTGSNGKITNVLANHGPQGVFDTVVSISGAPIEGWIMTGFLGFDTIAEAFGSFEIDLPIRIPASTGFPGFPKGPQVVEPSENLLLLARIRKVLPEGDLSRSFNHGVIMQGALREVQRRGIDGLPGLIQILDDTSFTSFSAGELLTLGATALLLDADNVANVVVPGSVGATSGGASIVRIGAAADAVFADQRDDGLLNGSAG